MQTQKVKQNDVLVLLVEILLEHGLSEKTEAFCS